MDGQLTPVLPRLHPSPSSHKSFYCKSTSLVSTAEPFCASSRLTTASMPDSMLRRLHINAPSEDFGEKTMAEVITSLSNPISRPGVSVREDENVAESPPPLKTLSPVHPQLSPQASCDSSIITFRRPSFLESDEERVTDVECGAPHAYLYEPKYKPLRNSKKDKYSTTALLKRANFSLASMSGSTVRSSDRMKNELLKFFKRSKNIKSSNSKCNAGTNLYRKPKIRRDLFSWKGQIGRFGRKKNFGAISVDQVVRVIQ